MSANKEPVSGSIAQIIESHRAVCTATAEQISDLESQLYIQLGLTLEPLLKDARQQLENVKATAAIFTAGAWRGDAVDQAVAMWRRQNPGLSAALKAVDGE